MFKSIRAAADPYLPDRFRDPEVVEAERRLAPGTPVRYPVGTRVTVLSVHHLGALGINSLGRIGFHPKRLVGQIGVIEDYQQVDGDVTALVGGITEKNELWPFYVDQITPA